MKRLFLTIILITSFFFKIDAQTTVISHGYAAALSDPINTWMLDMANGICARAGSGVIRIYNKATGNFDYISGSGSRTVLLFDWWDDSNDLHKGFTEGGGAALFAALMNGYVHDEFNLNDLHFIGHSRGCIVNSEAVERLLVLGFPVEQTTSIDAHDWGGGSIAITDYDANPDSIYSGVEGWAGIGWADSYWQDAFFSTNGRAVEGTYSVYMGTLSHDGIHDWYLQTITDTSLHEGYYFSKVGGGFSSRPPRTGVQRNTFFSFHEEGIMNGNFERGGAIYQKIAGWWYHGGGGDADIDGTYLALHYGGSYKIHDRFYIPPATNFIKFDYKINQNDDYDVIPNIDKLVVLLNDSIVLDNIYMDSVMDDWGQLSIDVSSLQNTVKTIEFRLVDEFGETDELNSEVFIENIRFEMMTVPVEEQVNSLVDFQLYPNPATDFIVISDYSLDKVVTNYSIFDILGHEIIKSNGVLNQEKGLNRIFVKTAMLSPGFYFIRLFKGNEVHEKKFIKS